MKPSRLPLVFAIPLLLAVEGCNPDSPFALVFNPPVCTIIDIQKSDATLGQPATMLMSVRNTSQATAYNVQCDVTLKSGNTVIDEASILFGTLGSGEQTSAEGWFWKINSHSEYSNAAYHLFWYDSQGTYHD